MMTKWLALSPGSISFGPWGGSVHDWSIELDGVEQTRRLGETLGQSLFAGAVVLLSGELGSGKTSLTQALARGLGVPDDEPVSSPSYTLMNHHRGRLDLYHFDLYRLSDRDELFELGFDEYLHDEGVTVVEWFDRIPDLRPEGLEIALSYQGEDARCATLTARGGRYHRLLEELRQKWPAGQTSTGR